MVILRHAPRIQELDVFMAPSTPQPRSNVAHPQIQVETHVVAPEAPSVVAGPVIAKIDELTVSVPESQYQSVPLKTKVGNITILDKHGHQHQQLAVPVAPQPHHSVPPQVTVEAHIVTPETSPVVVGQITPTIDEMTLSVPDTQSQ